MNEKLSILKEFLEDYSETIPEEIDVNTQLVANLGFNSLTLINMVNDAEERFGITISDEEMVRINTIGDVIKMLEEKNARF